MDLRRLSIRCLQGAIIAVLLLAAAATVIWRYAAGHLPADWVRGRIVSMIEAATGGRANVELGSAQVLSAIDGPRLVLDGFALRDADGRKVVGAPRAEIAFDLWTLLFGSGAMRSVELHDVEVRLSLNRDGQIELSSDNGVGAATSGDWSGLVGAVAAALSDKDAATSGLDRFGVRNGKLVIDDPGRGTNLRYDHIDISFEPTRMGRRLSVGAHGASRQWSIVAIRQNETPDRLSFELKDAPIADVAALLRMPVESRGGGVSGAIAVTLGESFAPQTIAADLGVRSGQLVLSPGRPNQTIISGLALKADWNAATRALTVSRAAVQTPDLAIEGSGGVAAQPNGDWSAEIVSGRGAVKSARADEPQIAIDRIAARGIWRADGGVAIPSWTIAGKDYQFSGDSRLTAEGEAGVSHVRVTGAAASIFAPLALWPRGLADDARNYLSQTVEKAAIDKFDLLLKVDAADRAALRDGQWIPRDSLAIEIAASHLRYAPLAEFPSIDIETARAKMNGESMQVVAPAAVIETPSKQRVTATDARFVSDYAAGPGPSRVEFRLKGAAEPAFDLLSTPLLKRVADLDDEIDVAKGAVDLKATLGFPINVPIKVEDVAVSIAGQLSGVTVDGVVPNDSITDFRGSLSFERGDFNLKGDGRIAGALTGVDVKRGANGAGEAILTTALDDAARQRKGLPSAPALTGPTPMKMSRQLGAKSSAARVDIDLTRAAINGALPGWTKPAGRPGKISFAYAPQTKSKDADLQDFTAESAGFLLKGVVTLGANNTLKAAKFSQARLSPGDDARIEWERVGNVGKLTVRGANIDARPLLRNIYDPQRGDAQLDAPEFEIDLKSTIFTGYNGEAATNVELRAAKRGAELRQFSLSGRFGRSDIRGQLSRRGEGPPRLSIETADGGAFLRFIDLYRRMIGGRLLIDVGVSEARQDGQLLVHDFALRNEPALRQAAPPASREADAGDVARTRRQDQRGDVGFERVRVDFVRSAGRIDIKDGVMLGSTLGVQFEGIIDAPRDRIDVTGAYVPAFALNNAFARVPVVGVILGGGGEHGGLFGVNFKVSGAFSQPAVSVNPLSALTPGLFRRFLEFNKQSVEGRAMIPPRDLGAARESGTR